VNDPPALWWSPTRGLIALLPRYDEFVYVQVMNENGEIGIGGRVMARLPQDAQPMMTSFQARVARLREYYDMHSTAAEMPDGGRWEE
jgi:hypothetical protein